MALQIYCAKVQGFWANPSSASPLEEPSFEGCIADAYDLLDALERKAGEKRNTALEEMRKRRNNERNATATLFGWVPKAG